MQTCKQSSVAVHPPCPNPLSPCRCSLCGCKPPQVLLVEDAAHLSSALQTLRASMQDPVIAIDLEWRPEFAKGRSNPVAMVQLASSRVAVLIRTCRIVGTQGLPKELPAALRAFLQDPSVLLLGFGWATGDEGKMQRTFGTGCRDFGRFVDLQAVARSLEYCELGLASLAGRVLRLAVPKARKVSMSNWEAPHLTPQQVRKDRWCACWRCIHETDCWQCTATLM